MQIRLIASKIKKGAAVVYFDLKAGRNTQQAAIANNFLNFLRMSCYLNGQLNITMTNTLSEFNMTKQK